MLDDEVGHVGIDFAGQFDEASAEVVFLGFPGQIKGVDGDAVTAEAGSGIEGLKAEWLGLGCVDDFVNIDAHAHAELLELVDQRDVDAAIDVFKELGHLGDGGAADGDYTTEDGTVEGGSKFDRGGTATPHYLGNVVTGDGVIAGIFALGRKGNVEARLAGSTGSFEAAGVAFFEQRENDIVCCAGIGGALKNDELPLMNMGRDGLNRAGDVTKVGLVILVERGGDADDDDVHGFDFGVIGGGVEAEFLRVLNGIREDADNVGAAGVEGAYLICRDVETGYAETFAAEEKCQRKADVSHAYDSDTGFSGFDLLFQFCEFNGGGSHIPDCKTRGAGGDIQRKGAGRKYSRLFRANEGSLSGSMQDFGACFDFLVRERVT